MYSLGEQRFSCTFLGIKSFNKLLLGILLLLLFLLLSGLLLLAFCSLIFIHVRIDSDSHRLGKKCPHTRCMIRQATILPQPECVATPDEASTPTWTQSPSQSPSGVYSLSQSLPTCRWRIPATILGKCVGVGAGTKSNRKPASRFNSF